ncbi:ABC transporter substrate-binding protein [Streptomyces sp. NPDC091280]|uniref:ABC transporter substrate-binding protein n=1 Tax=Streptomyces sp. NPDC091280 TaxID=3365984 RepID=UPI00382D9DA6
MTDVLTGGSFPSRRDLLKYGTLGGATLLGGAALTACGGAQPGQPEQGAGKEQLHYGAPKRGGVLRHGMTGGSFSDTLDPAKGMNALDTARAGALFDNVWSPDADYRIQKWLAEEYSSNATADVWTVRLRNGVEFHNGKTLTADDLIHTIRRTLDPSLASPYAGSLAMIDPKQLRKLDDRTVRIGLTSGFVPLPEAMSTFVYVVPVDFDPHRPVGTGPFKYKSFQPGRQSVFTRFENYWRPGHPYVDELHIIDYADDTSRLNALKTGQIDIVDGVPYPLAATLSGQTGIRIVKSSKAAIEAFGMRADIAPFNDNRVREAFRLIVDRPALIKSSVLGYATVANDLFAWQDPAFDHALPQRHQDLDKAKSLLRQAGHGNGLVVQLTTSDLLSGMISGAEVFAEQAKGAGVTVQVDKVDPGTFFGSQGLNFPFAANIPSTGNILISATYTDGPGSTANSTHFHDAEYDSLFKQAIRQTDDAKRTELIHRMQRIQYERGTFIIPAYIDILDASRGVSGAEPEVGGMPYYRYGNLWLA